MKIIHRAILRELLVAFLLSLFSLNFILMMEKVLRLSRILSGLGASAADFLKIILYLQPQLMLLTIPMSLLLSMLLTYGRLNSDNELTILRTAGMSFSGMTAPVFVLGTVCFSLGLLGSFILGPGGAGKVRETLSNIIVQRAPMAIEPGVFNTSFKGIVILTRERPSPREIRGIFIYDSRNKAEPTVLVAKEGRIEADRDYNISIYLKDGLIHIARPDDSTELFFNGYNLTLALSAEGPSRKNSEMTPLELIRETRGRDNKEKTPLLLEFHRRLSLPSLCLILMFLGPPLSLVSGKSGRLGGLTLGLGVFTIFYVILIYGENMAKAGSIPHYIAGWAPVLLIGAVSLFTYRKAGSQ